MFYTRCSGKPHTNISKGDLGHTDLQEDLEFHSSSMRLKTPHIHSTCL
jgi:hypothetical protein